ncbi:DUF2865 domain-containing protein [Bosea sp. (in: a-proteobacteria)]|jgi:hypothetical protein|uniref:DUF2865 domain-containing protein n=1 Tax=Bosea sp. (in: a-proteobacteria) TaxID=1871050 RepID=UPI003F70B215
MFRVRETSGQGNLPPEPARAVAPVVNAGRPIRLAALTALGLSLGAGGAILTVSLVQAGDDAGVRAFQLEEAASRRLARAPRDGVYSASAYAPARNTWTLPLFRTIPDGRIAHPPVVLNPFKPTEAAPRRHQAARHAGSRVPTRTVATKTAATRMARTICVRLCDGFHAPLGDLHAQSDLKAHDALCRAMNPGIPVKVFRVSAGADTIDGAVAQDGKTYGSLPVAYGHEKSADPACRPPIVAEGERRVSLLRDITLRPGDSVVLDGKVKTFTGSSRWPYSPRDFVDFRAAGELSASQRRSIDQRVGVSRDEAQLQALRRRMRTREAALHDDNLMSDAVVLRGSIDPQARGPVRVVAQSPFAAQP